LSCTTTGLQRGPRPPSSVRFAVMPVICDFPGDLEERRTISTYTREIVSERLAEVATIANQAAVDSLINTLGIDYFSLSQIDPLAGFVQKEASAISPENLRGLKAIQDKLKCQGLVFTWLEVGSAYQRRVEIPLIEIGVHRHQAVKVEANAVVISAAVVDFSSSNIFWQKGGVTVVNLEADANYVLFEVHRFLSPVDVLSPELGDRAVNKLFHGIERMQWY